MTGLHGFFMSRARQIVGKAFVSESFEVPTGIFEQDVGTDGKVKIFGIGIGVLVDHVADDSHQLSFVVKDWTAAVARTDRSGHLNGAALNARDDAGAQSKSEPFRMADHENRFAVRKLWQFCDGLNECALTTFPRNPEQEEIKIVMSRHD